MDTITNEKLLSLHRYWLWAEYLRKLFLESAAVDNASPMSVEWFANKSGMLMSHWYSALFVVVEGYSELGLKDDIVDELLKVSENIELLKRYRNGTAHYQKNYFDKRFLEFMSVKGSAKWIHKLSEEMGSFLLKKMSVINTQKSQS
jgi:hypothetical protein